MYICNVFRVVIITNYQMDKINPYKKLMEYNIKPSPQRMAIMEYLLNSCNHPTIDEIYSCLIKSMPTLSKTTIYNTLKLFIENGAAQMLTINEKTSCYDADTSLHAHFICEKCNRVLDLYYGVEDILPKSESMHGHIIKSMQVYYRGICKDCKTKVN